MLASESKYLWGLISISHWGVGVCTERRKLSYSCSEILLGNLHGLGQIFKIRQAAADGLHVISPPDEGDEE